ncbi:MAG: aldehyde dehydrogenase family protein [Solirubrobacteraceae bacterium]
MATTEKGVLELGGGDPFIVLDGEHLEHTIDAAIAGRMANTGQSCVASKRFIVLADIYEKLVERFAERLSALEPGDPVEEATTLGPLSSAQAVEDLEEQVNDAIERGATAVVGGRRIQRPGNYFQATLLTGVIPEDRALPIAQREVIVLLPR